MSLHEAKVKKVSSHTDDDKDHHSHASYDYDDDANSIIAIASDFEEEIDLPPHAPRNQRPSNKESLEGQTRTNLPSAQEDAGKKKVFTYNESPTSLVSQLQFDLNQHWERSLLHELEAIDQETFYTKLFPRPQKGPLILLRHTDSRDIAVDIDRDDMTLTDASSMSLPYRSQIIHRLGPQGHAPIFDDETEVSTTTTDGKSFPLNINNDDTHSANVSHVGSDSSETIEETREDSHSSVVSLSDSKKSKPVHRKTDSTGSSSYQELLRSRAFSEEKRMLSPWIELEQGSDDDEDDDDDYFVSIGNPMDQHPACACWGYNILDFWLPPPDAQVRKRRIVTTTTNNMSGNTTTTSPTTTRGIHHQMRLGRLHDNGPTSSFSPPQPERKRRSRRERNVAAEVF